MTLPAIPRWHPALAPSQASTSAVSALDLMTVLLDHANARSGPRIVAGDLNSCPHVVCPDYAGRMELMRHFWDAAVALDPAAADLDEGVRFPICRPERLEALWCGAGLADVRFRAIEPSKV